MNFLHYIKKTWEGRQNDEAGVGLHNYIRLNTSPLMSSALCIGRKYLPVGHGESERHDQKEQLWVHVRSSSQYYFLKTT